MHWAADVPFVRIASRAPVVPDKHAVCALVSLCYMYLCVCMRTLHVCMHTYIHFDGSCDSVWEVDACWTVYTCTCAPVSAKFDVIF